MNALLFTTILILLKIFSGQHSLQQSIETLSVTTSIIARGDTVSELGNNIMLVYQDKNDRYWFGSWETGLYSFDGSAILHYTAKHGFPHNRINEIKEDNKGNLYFNTPEGVLKYDGKTFNTLPISRSNEWKLQPDDVWFKNELAPGHACRYDGTTLHILTLPTTPIAEKYNADIRSQYPNLRHTPYDVYTVYKDSHRNIWFGTGVAGVCRYNGIRHDWITSSDVNEFHYGPSNGVRSIMEDQHGDFWFCNTIYRYNIYDTAFPVRSPQDTFYYERHKGIGSLDGIDPDFQEYMSATLDTNGHVWIASYGAGVYRYDGKNIHHFPVQDEGNDITVFSIYKDNKGHLWLGTHESGAYKFNGTAFEKFKPKH